MKSTFALSTLGLAAVLSMTVACENEGSAVSCTDDADCANEELNTTCDPDVGVCVEASDPVCADDADCDIANSDSPSVASDCAADTDCDDASGEVCVADGVDATYCVLADSDNAGEGCEELDASFSVATFDGVDVCVVDAGETCTDGECVAE